MSFTKECCTRQPVESDYNAKGSNSTTLGDLIIYETVDKTPKKLLILVHDIFGMHKNAMQFADIVGSAGYRVIVPDFFRGKPMSQENFPPKDFQDIFTWIAKAGDWDTIIKPDLLTIIDHYKNNEGITSFGIFGFCFGGKVSLKASAEIPEIKCAGLIHPSMVMTEEANEVKSPVIVIPSKDEPDLLPFAKIVKERLGDEACVHVLMADMFHGYAGARGDYGNELNRKRVEETIDLLISFFNKYVK